MLYIPTFHFNTFKHIILYMYIQYTVCSKRTTNHFNCFDGKSRCIQMGYFQRYMINDYINRKYII